MPLVMDSPISIKSGARFHVIEAPGPGAELPLPSVAAHHAARVLRLSPGDPVVVFDGTGGEYEAVITRIGRGEVLVRTGRFRADGPESPLRVTLAQGVSAGDRMDFTVRKSVELGVDRIVPVITGRSVVRLGGERADRRRAHWQGVAVSACEQSGRNRVPPVEEPVAFETWLAGLDPSGRETRLALATQGTRRLAELPAPAMGVLLLAGPEGGFSGPEMHLAQSRGFEPIRLGPRILRTETAGLAALAALQTLWGDF